MERRVPFALKIPSLWPSCGGEGNGLIGRISAANEKLSADNFCNDARAGAGKKWGRIAMRSFYAWKHPAACLAVNSCGGQKLSADNFALRHGCKLFSARLSGRASAAEGDQIRA
ncbi:hypothetical protein [Leisingera sp. NJS204]|uniref:hypothetical protein n=1 Tax=Leisingera sp. NJS204 TaxID=2508307 RepID=UPI001011F250|nr:hypothetical protein [Leisingera sp. NJS204]QAX31916.1 hypothetical protein ETW24_21215 [Leisingera sp. NJS204]